MSKAHPQSPPPCDTTQLLDRTEWEEMERKLPSRLLEA